MTIAELRLSEDERAILEDMAQRAGKAPEDLVREAVRQRIAEFQSEDRLRLLRQARGMWKDRTDLPSLAELRREWGRRLESNHGEQLAD
jgi:hypothetical protein